MLKSYRKPAEGEELIEHDGQSQNMSACIVLLGQLSNATSDESLRAAAGESLQPAHFILLSVIPELDQSLDLISLYKGNIDKDKLEQLAATIDRCVLDIQSNRQQLSFIDSASTPIPTFRLQAAAEAYDAIVKANQLLLTLQASSQEDSAGKKDTEKNKEDNPFRQYINTRNSDSKKRIKELAVLETDFNKSCVLLQIVVKKNTMKSSSKSERDIQDSTAVQELSLSVKTSKESLLALMGEIENIPRNEALNEKLEYLRLRLQCVDMALDYLDSHPVPTQGTMAGYWHKHVKGGKGDSHHKQPLWSMLLCSPPYLYITLAEMFRPSISKGPLDLLEKFVRNRQLLTAYRSFHLFMVAALFVLKDESKTAEDKQKELVVKGQASSSKLVCLLRQLHTGNLKRLDPDYCVISGTDSNVSNKEYSEVRRGWVNANSASYIDALFQQVSTAVELDADDHSFLSNN